MSTGRDATRDEILRAFAGRRILVVGDAMLDRFVWAEASRVSPEAPVPVVRVRSESESLGGAANVAANLTRLGAAVRLAAIRGVDPEGERLEGLLGEQGIVPLLQADAARPTVVKTRVMARSRQIVRIDREEEGPVSTDVGERLEARSIEALAETDALVVSDYAKGAFTPGRLHRLLHEARKRGIPSVVDPKPAHFDAYRGATVLTPNQAEAAAALSVPVDTDDRCVAAAEGMLSRLDTSAVLITRGKRGMLLLERGHDPCFIPAVAREVFDVTGAGDTVAAVVALTLAAGGSLRRAAELANRAAGLVVSKVGTATVAPAELLDGVPRAARARRA